MARWFYTNTSAEHKTIRGNPFVCGDGRHGSDEDVTGIGSDGCCREPNQGAILVVLQASWQHGKGMSR